MLMTNLASNIGLPIICLFGCLTNGISIAVFLNPQMKDISFKYMLVVSMSDFMNLALNSYTFMSFCEECPQNKYYSTQFHRLYLSRYLAGCFALLSVATEVFLSYQRYMILLNKKQLKLRSHFLIIVILLVISLIIHTPFALDRDIVSIKENNTNQTIGYELKPNAIDCSVAYKVITFLVVILRQILGTVVLSVINLLNVFEMRKRFINSAANKKKMSKNDQSKLEASRSITLMVIWAWAFSFFGNLPDLLAFILNNLLEPSSKLKALSNLGLTIVLLERGLNFFIYLFFNKLFRKTLAIYFRRLLFLS